jgi:cysteine-rich repeat protein
LGLPCRDSDDCGRGQECIDGFCGGEASTKLCGNDVVDPGEDCDQGDQNSNEGNCKADCTTQFCGDGFKGPNESCDDGNTQNGDECSSECILESCGNGSMDPGEECDEGEDNSDTGSCTTACLLPKCGDGFAQTDEDCDDAGESATCDADCTVVECGDMVINSEAGEECDNDSPAADDADCMSSCTPPLLWDDLEPGGDEVLWDHDVISGDVSDDWAIVNEDTSTWYSGAPPANNEGAPGQVRLWSPAIDLTELDGETIELRIRTAWAFLDTCNNKPATAAFEGAVVELKIDSGDFEIVDPKQGGYPGTIGDDVDVMCNPLDGQDAFVLEDPFHTVEFDISQGAGSTIEVGFLINWDCGNECVDVSANGWWIDDIVVWRP